MTKAVDAIYRPDPRSDCAERMGVLVLLSQATILMKELKLEVSRVKTKMRRRRRRKKMKKSSPRLNVTRRLESREFAIAKRALSSLNYIMLRID
jgi:hypothetical protein